MSGIQKQLNAELRQKIHIEDFKQEVLKTKVKNTSDRRCRECGSDNIYVISV